MGVGTCTGRVIDEEQESRRNLVNLVNLVKVFLESMAWAMAAHVHMPHIIITFTESISHLGHFSSFRCACPYNCITIQSMTNNKNF